jgi:hypothetical protein
LSEKHLLYSPLRQPNENCQTVLFRILKQANIAALVLGLLAYGVFADSHMDFRATVFLGYPITVFFCPFFANKCNECPSVQQQRKPCYGSTGVIDCGYPYMKLVFRNFYFLAACVGIAFQYIIPTEILQMKLYVKNNYCLDEIKNTRVFKRIPCQICRRTIDTCPCKFPLVFHEKM